jgi:hypothetical protein
MAFQFSTDAFRGCLAHELSHIVLEIKKNLLVDFWQFLTHRRNESELERQTDMLVVERGLGRQLLLFHKEHGKKYKSYKSCQDLTKGEIRQRLKSDR